MVDSLKRYRNMGSDGEGVSAATISARGFVSP